MAKSLLFKRIRRLLRGANEARQLGLKPREYEALVADPSRRDFLRMALIGTGGLLAGCELSAPPTPPATAVGAGERPVVLPAAADEVPVVILGGGGAGLAAAYTLQKAGIRCEIYEASARVGGRIFTARNINGDGQFFERGAELVDSNHTALIELAKELGLTIEDFRDEPGAKDRIGELHWIDGKRYSEHEFVHAARPMFEKIVEANREMLHNGKAPDLADPRQYNDAVRKYDRMTLRAFLDAQSIDPWVKKAVEIAFLCEYGRELEEQSALNLITVIGPPDRLPDPKEFSMFGISDETKRVKGGNDGIILRLREVLTGGLPDEQQRQIFYHHRLVALRERPGGFVCTFATDAGPVEVSTRQLICTLPFPLLNEVEGIRKLALSARKQTAIAQFQIGQNSKVVNSFSSRVWRKPAGGQPGFSGAVYANSEIQNFWESSRLQAGNRGLITALLGGKVGREAGAESIARHAALIDQTFPGSAAAYEGIGIVMNWNKMIYNRGSYTCFGAGQYEAFFGAAGEPELGGRLLFAGEHTSNEFTGFMNGAYETGIAAATAIIERVKAKAAA